MGEARERNKNIYRIDWEEFKEYLSKRPNFLEDDIELWKKKNFFMQFDDAVKHCLAFLEVKGHAVSPFYRGTGINEEIAKDNYSRMIPSPKHSALNRMSPAGIPYLYVTPNMKNDKALQLNTIVSELRADPEDYFTICSFHTNGPLKLVSLVGDPNLQVEEKELGNILLEQLAGRGKKERIEQAKKLLIQLYFSFFNEDNIFKPIPRGTTDEDKDIEYRPFQAIAKYFEWLGYDGLIYKSTVYEGGINAVIFNAKKVVLNKDSLKKYIVPQTQNIHFI